MKSVPESPGLPFLPDLRDPALYAEGDPHAAWRAMRGAGPVHRHEGRGSPFWSVVAHEPAVEVLSDWRRFTSVNGTMLRTDLSKPYPGSGKMLVLTDPPRHTQIRRSLTHLFTRRAVRKFEEVARRTVAALLDGMRERGGGDFVADVAAPLPLSVSAGLLGVAPADVPLIVEASARATEGATDEADPAAEMGHHEVMMYYFQVLRDRRKCPANDLVSALLEAKVDGLGLTDEEILLTCDNVVVAASETARHAASGGLLALLERPTAWESLRSGDVDMSRAVEEILRWTAPATHVLRTAVADTELTGVRIGAGDALAVWTPSANRDETVFQDPDELLLDRHPNPHLTFGAGMHFCIGSALVRLILRVLLEELAARFDGVALAGTPRRNGSWVGSGLASLPLTVG
ncbi:cytochrome P450 [Streptomyces sp. LZ34]